LQTKDKELEDMKKVSSAKDIELSKSAQTIRSLQQQIENLNKQIPRKKLQHEISKENLGNSNNVNENVNVNVNGNENISGIQDNDNESLAKEGYDMQGEKLRLIEMVEAQQQELSKLKQHLSKAKHKRKKMEVELLETKAKLAEVQEKDGTERDALLVKMKESLVQKVEELRKSEIALQQELEERKLRDRKMSFSNLLAKGSKVIQIPGRPGDEILVKEEKEKRKAEKKAEKKRLKQLKREAKEKEHNEKKLEQKLKKGEKKKKKETKNPNAIFGLSLQELYQKQPRDVPLILEVLQNFLETHQVYETEGIFRIAGRNLTIEQLRDAFDAAGVGNEHLVDLSEADIHDVAGLFKLFFASLPEPLFSYALYDPLVKAQEKFESLGDVSEEAKSEHIRALAEIFVQQLPSQNLKIFLFLLRFLKKITQFQEKNKMGPQNLAIVFSPSLLRPQVMDINYQLQMSKLSGLVQAMIVGCDQLEIALKKE
jgi:hypothetical protein